MKSYGIRIGSLIKTCLKGFILIFKMLFPSKGVELASFLITRTILLLFISYKDSSFVSLDDRGGKKE